MVSRDADVRGVVFDHLRDHIEYAGNCAKRRIRFVEATQTVEVAEQFVGAVDEVDDHLIRGDLKQVTLTAKSSLKR